MVHASVHVEFIVSMCGWAIQHGSRNFDLPLLQLPTDLHHHPTSPHLPYQLHGEGDHQVNSLGFPGETSRHSPHQSQEIQDSREKTSNQKQKALTWSSHADLSLPGSLHRLQGWLSCGGLSLTVLWSTSLPSSPPKQAHTNNLVGLIQFLLLSHWRRQPRIEMHLSTTPISSRTYVSTRIMDKSVELQKG